jgi:hypothetical protein
MGKGLDAKKHQNITPSAAASKCQDPLIGGSRGRVTPQETQGH